MRKTKVILLIGSTVVAVSTALFGGLWLAAQHKAVQLEAFYGERPLLNSMQSRQTASTFVSSGARDAFLGVVPLNTTRDVAIAALTQEGFSCHQIREPAADSLLRARWLATHEVPNPPADKLVTNSNIDCQIVHSAVAGEIRWIVQLQFSPADRLIDVNVAKLNIFL